MHYYSRTKIPCLRISVTLRVAVYRRSVRLGGKPLSTNGQRFPPPPPPQWNPCDHSPYVITSSLMKGRACRLQLLLALASAGILGSEPRGTHGHILLSQILDSPNLEGQVPVFISPRNKVAQLYPQALSSLFVASYDSQGYGGDT
jgi:hypothetical protein